MDARSGFHTGSEGGQLEGSGEEPGINWEMNLEGKFTAPAIDGKPWVGLNSWKGGL